MKEKKPWYVRLTEFLWEKQLNIPGWCATLVAVILFAVIFAICFNMAKSETNVLCESYTGVLEVGEYARQTLTNKVIEKLFTVVIGLITLYLGCVILSIGPAIATHVWRKKQKMQNFHNNN